MIRAATRADHEALLLLYRENDALHAALQPGFFRLPPVHVHALARGDHALRQTLAQKNEALLVACTDPATDPRQTPAPAGWPEGGVCGLIHLTVYDTPASPSMVQARRAHVADLVVAGWARRRGHGRRLLSHGAAWARERGADQVVLTVWTGNDEAAAFYRSLGYHAVSQVLAHTLVS